VSADVAASSKLAYFDDNLDKVIVKVDNTTNVPFNEKRNTVKITTKDQYGPGSIWIADMTHVPFGCSVWPAFWSQAPGWPTGGEIDTFEGVNLNVRNQISLHTLDGCKQVDPVQSSKLINSTDCSFNTNGNQGCITSDPASNSYGADFAAAGGGVFVTEFADTGISIWFFSRNDIPSVISSSTNSFDTKDLGAPTANYPNGGCSMSQFFKPQNIIIDITLCGDFAGSPQIFPQTCSGKCYPDYVVGNGTAYADAYFAFNYVRFFSSNPNSGGSSSGGNSSGSGSDGGNSGTGAAVTTRVGVGAVFSVMLLALGAMAL
jgi:hypothetical protein